MPPGRGRGADPVAKGSGRGPVSGGGSKLNSTRDTTRWHDPHSGTIAVPLSGGGRTADSSTRGWVRARSVRRHYPPRPSTAENSHSQQKRKHLWSGCTGWVATCTQAGPKVDPTCNPRAVGVLGFAFAVDVAATRWLWRLLRRTSWGYLWTPKRAGNPCRSLGGPGGSWKGARCQPLGHDTRR